MISHRVTDGRRFGRHSILTSCLAISLALCSALPMSGCRKEEEAPPPPPPPPPPVKTVPEWSQILITVPAGEKVSVENAMREDCTRDQMEETIRFVNAFASGDNETLKPMLESLSQNVLDDLVDQGLWQEETSAIRELTLMYCAKNGPGFAVGFSITTDSGDSQTYTWMADMKGDTAIFKPAFKMPQEPEADTASTASNSDHPDTAGEREGGNDTGPQKGRPERDPRKRVPPQGPDPGGPDGPG